MNNTIEIAQKVFTKIQQEAPNLTMRIHIDEPVELCMDILKQAGLKFDVHLNLQNNDELHLVIGNFWCEWFPCTKEEKVEQYIDAALGLLSGRYRILEHYHGKKAIKAELQVPENDGWKTTATWETFWLPFPWLKRDERILQNI